MKRLPTVERIEELLQIGDPPDPAYPLYPVSWRNKRARIHAGQRAGTLDPAGFWKITLDDRVLRASRIIFALTHNRWPVGMVRHLNGDVTDYRPENLVEVGRRAACYCPTCGKSQRVQVQILVGGKRKYIGIADSPADAARMRDDARLGMMHPMRKSNDGR